MQQYVNEVRTQNKKEENKIIVIGVKIFIQYTIFFVYSFNERKIMKIVHEIRTLKRFSRFNFAPG